MADEDVTIEATAGPYAGKRMTVSEAEAKAAIKEGWAKDPFAAPEEGKEVKEITEEDRQKIIEAATKAAERLRAGESATESATTADKKTRAMEAEDSAEYQTKGGKRK